MARRGGLKAHSRLERKEAGRSPPLSWRDNQAGLAKPYIRFLVVLTVIAIVIILGSIIVLDGRRTRRRVQGGQ